MKINKEEQNMQQEIGQQIMIVRMVHDENNIVSKGGFSFLNTSKIAKWAQKSEEEMGEFLDAISALYELKICVDAAMKYAEGLSVDAFGFFLSTFRMYGYYYIENMLGIKQPFDPNFDRIKELAKINAKKIIDKGIIVDEEIQSAERFEDSLQFYFKFYISRIAEVVDKGYDWDVVSEMLGEDKEFTELIKPLVICSDNYNFYT